MKARCLVFACTLCVIYVLFFSFAEGWNGQSRWALSLALARSGSTAVDEFIGESRDVCLSRGHFYAAKAPGIGLLGAPLVWGADRIVPSRSPSAEVAKRFLVRMVLVSMPAAMIGMILCRSGLPSAGLAAAACCLGSPVMPYATLLYGHVPSALALLGAWRLAASRAFVPAGIAAGAAIAVDYLSGVGVAFLLLVVAWESRRALSRMLLGMLPAGLLVCLYNLVSFGTPLATGYEGLADEEFAAIASQGFRSVGAPSLRNLAALSFGTYRGLFLLSPWLILWFAAALRARRPWQERMMTVVLPGAYLVLLSGVPVWWGGASCGVRHAITVIPLMAWAVASLDGRWRTTLLILGMLASAAQIGFTATEPEMPEDVRFPLVDFVFPHLLTGRFRSTILAALGAGPWVALIIAGAAGVSLWGMAWRDGSCWAAGRIISWLRRTIHHGSSLRRIP
ncbi:MAG: hypothetical protein MUE60_03210 [Candidatus Eisenbacteria bacterium]|nr:hypothetical protein [Candidatus Eisenbacteria bacterium]